MVSLADIKGQPRAVANLLRILALDRVAHAYLFSGPEGCGKYTSGLALAAALNCTSRAHPSNEPSCGHCESCEKVAAGQHPDVQTLQREGAAQIIPIDTIRCQLIPQLAMPPHEGRVRVFLVEEANSLKGPSANAMLKTLEEPPPRTHFILCTTAPDQLLPTIRSRCQRVSFAALDPEVRAEISGGADPADDEGTQRLQALADQLEEAICAPTHGSVFRAAGEMPRERSELVSTLQLLAARLHGAAKRAALEHDLAAAAALSRQAASVLATETAVSTHNAHGQLAMEHLLHDLRALALPHGMRTGSKA